MDDCQMPVSSILLMERLWSAQLLAVEQDSQASIFRQAGLFYKHWSAGSILKVQFYKLCSAGSLLYTLSCRFSFLYYRLNSAYSLLQILQVQFSVLQVQFLQNERQDMICE